MQGIVAQQRADVVTAIALAAMAESYVKFLDVRSASVRTYANAVRQFVRWVDEKGIRNPDRLDVIAWREDMTKSGKKSATVQTYIVAVRLFFRWTSQEGLYPNIADHVKGVKVSRYHKKDPLTANQAAEVLHQVKQRGDLVGLRDYAIISTALAGGLRTIEIVRANKGDLRTRAQESGPDLHLLNLQGKGRDDADEFVIIPEKVYKAIAAYLKARGRSRDSDPLFASTSNRNKGGRMTTRSVSRIVKNALIEAGLESERLTAHSLRHTAGTLALKGGQPIQDVQQFLRHANIDTTMIYIKEADRLENKGSQTVADAIFKEEADT